MPQSGLNLLLPLPIFQTQLASKLPVRPPSLFPYTSTSSTIINNAVTTTVANTIGATGTYTTPVHTALPFPATNHPIVSHYE